MSLKAPVSSAAVWSACFFSPASVCRCSACASDAATALSAALARSTSLVCHSTSFACMSFWWVEAELSSPSRMRRRSEMSVSICLRMRATSPPVSAVGLAARVVLSLVTKWPRPLLGALAAMASRRSISRWTASEERVWGSWKSCCAPLTALVLLLSVSSPSMVMTCWMRPCSSRRLCRSASLLVLRSWAVLVASLYAVSYFSYCCRA
mmetsp:Transcript_75898/g.203325  ORF Transcript_75898/g.203325 Transcript_75898/m.203325 type:complete len:208 (-) Transcript_75898:604-1227(-)